MSADKWSGKGWKIAVTETEITIVQASGSTGIPSTEASRLEVRRRWFQWSLHHDGQSRTHLRGMTRSEASALTLALQRLVLSPAIADATTWHADVTHLLAGACTAQRWIPSEAVDTLLATRPEPRLLDRVRAAGCERLVTEDELRVVGFLDADLATLVANINEQITAAELLSRR
ncbi:MAG: hypothetical protein ACYCV7_16880, partial [Acidimicrobiales bacterium]